MKAYKTIYTTLFLLYLYLIIPLPLIAGSPTDQLRATMDKVQLVLHNRRLMSDKREKQRYRRLTQIIHPRFDFVEKAKRSLGSHWQQRTPEEQREFVRIFSAYLTHSFLRQIESHNNGAFYYTHETQDQDYAEVDTKLVTKKGKELSINYKLHRSNGDWKIYDIVIEKISLINNYRSQFHRIITNDSYEELLRRMTDKAAWEGEQAKLDEEKLRAIRGWMIMSLFTKGSKPN